MILVDRPTLARADLQMNEQNKDLNRYPYGRGVLVRVLVENIYNGPDLKALPTALVGDVISVAGGTYAVDLINQKLVEPFTFSDPDRIHDIPDGMVLTSGTEDRPLVINPDLLGQKKNPTLDPKLQPHMLYGEPDPSLDIQLRTDEQVADHLRKLDDDQERLANGEEGQTILTRQPNPIITTYGGEFGAADAPIFISTTGQTQQELGMDSPLYARPGQAGSNDPKALLIPVTPPETGETGKDGSTVLIPPPGPFPPSAGSRQDFGANARAGRPGAFVEPAEPAKVVGDGHPWAFWEEAGLSNQLAQAVYEHGFATKALLVEKVNRDGYDGLTAVPGMNKKRAQALYTWAAAS